MVSRRRRVWLRMMLHPNCLSTALNQSDALLFSVAGLCTCVFFACAGRRSGFLEQISDI